MAHHLGLFWLIRANGVSGGEKKKRTGWGTPSVRCGLVVVEEPLSLFVILERVRHIKDITSRGLRSRMKREGKQARLIDLFRWLELARGACGFGYVHSQYSTADGDRPRIKG